MVLIPDYNETYIGRHWDGNQWNKERYDTEIEVELQKKVAELQTATEKVRELNAELSRHNVDLTKGIKDIQQNTLLEGMMIEVMTMLAAMSNPGGVE